MLDRIDTANSLTEIAGVRIELIKRGTGRPLLLLHPAIGIKSTDRVIDELARSFTLIAPSHPGFGRSELPRAMTTVDDLAYFYLDLMEAMDLREVVLAGVSFGGWIAAEIAIRSTARLASLALLAPAGVETREAMFDDIFAWTTEEFARRQFHDPKLAQQWQQAQAKLDIDIALQNRTALARLGWNPRMHNPQLPYWLHRIDVPTLLVWGEDDQVVPFACHKPFKREIRNAELLALPKSGHALPIERAHEVGARLAPFFQGAQG